MSNKAQIDEEEDESFKKIKEGFTVNYMQMRDGSKGRIMWEVKSWDLKKSNHTENITKDLLKCKIITRNINFSSKEAIEDLELVQNFYLMGELYESSKFKFGFVIPNSTNDWEQIIMAKEDGVLPAEVLSGKLKVETLFLCEGKIIIKNKILISYV